MNDVLDLVPPVLTSPSGRHHRSKRAAAPPLTGPPDNNSFVAYKGGPLAESDTALKVSDDVTFVIRAWIKYS